MSDQTPPPQSSDETTDKEKTQESDVDVVKQAQQEQEKNLNQELPELQNFSIIAQGLGGLALLYTDKHVKFINSFRVLNNPDYAVNLLNLRDPEKFREIQEAHAVAGKEIAKQREKQQKIKDKGGIPKDYAQVGLGPFKGQKIEFTTYDRELQAYRMAHDLQKHINGTELQLKTNSAVANFGLDKGRARQLKIDFAEWHRKNHGSFDEYFRAHQKQIQKLHQQQYRADGKDPQKEKADFQGGVNRTKERFKTAKTEAVGKHVFQIQDTQKAIEDLLHPKVPLVPKSGPLPPPPSPPPPPPSIPPTPSILPPTIPSPTTLPIQPTSALGLRQRLLGALSRNAIGQSAKSAVSSITGFLGKKAITGTALKLGISALAGTATGGIATAAQLGLKLGKALFTAIGEKLPIIGDFIKNIGKAFDLPGKAIKYAALAAVLAIVGIFILILFFTSGSNMPTLTSADAITVPTKKEEVNAYNWPDFEKAVLGALDTNGHDQVKK